MAGAIGREECSLSSDVVKGTAEMSIRKTIVIQISTRSAPRSTVY